MDVVVRTPHGDADITIVSAPGTTTLGDLLAAVTGQAPPAVARVGDRANARVVGTSQQLDAIGLHVGAVIDSRPEEAASAPASDGAAAVRVDLLQLTGRGAGAIRTLTPGRYRIGAGRRLNADELARAPVETTAFEIDVRDTGEVFVTPGPRIGESASEVTGALAPTLGDVVFDQRAAWTHGRLSVAGRAFELSTATSDVDSSWAVAEGPGAIRLAGEAGSAAVDRLDVDDRGTIPFQRTPVTSRHPDVLAVSAQRRAASPSNGLWATRRSDPDAYALPFGLAPHGLARDGDEIRLEIGAHAKSALVGSERFTEALARSLIAEATTRHGPSDLLVAVASTPDRIGHWDWVKWLPHTRGGDPTAAPQLLTSHDELSEWASRMAGAPPEATPTLLLLDGVSLWTHRDSPLHSLVTNPPSHLHLMTLCASIPEAPGGCTVIIEEHAPESMETLEYRHTREGAALVGSLARLHLLDEPRPEIVGDIRPALVTVDAALAIALDVAPYDDLDIVRPAVTRTSMQPPSISELVELQEGARVGQGLDVAIGIVDEQHSVGIGAPLAPRRPARIDLSAARTTLLTCDDREVHDAVVAALILGAAAIRRSDRLAILTVGSSQPGWHAEVPHLAGHVDRSTPDDPVRLIHRVAHVLSTDPGLEVLVVIEDAFTTSQPIHTGRGATPLDLTAGILELVDSLSRVHVVMTSELPGDQLDAATRSRCGIEIDLAGPAEHPRGFATDADSRVPIIGPTRVGSAHRESASDRDAVERGLRLAPSVHGRAMTPLERRVERLAKQRSASVSDQTEAREVAQRIAGEAGSAAAANSLLPPPLPTSVPLAQLLDRHPGDGVPIGLVDRPETANSEAYWWRPGQHGSLLAVGSPRSGIADIIDLLTVGTAARLSPDDVRIHAIEPLPQRRRALSTLPHCVEVVSTDEPADTSRVIADIARLLGTRRGSERGVDDPDVVLMVGDLGRLRRWLPEGSASTTLEQLATISADGPAFGINLVCIAARGDDLGPLVRLSGDRLVGTLSDAADRRRLGVPTPGPADRHAGRCWSVDVERRVQLATPPESVEAEVTRMTLPDRTPS